MNPLKCFGSTRAPASVLLIRVMVGVVFLTEGVQKFLSEHAARGAHGFLHAAGPAVPADRRRGRVVGGCRALAQTDER